jgi:hypothetical protein
VLYIAGKNMEVKPSPTEAGWFNVYSPAGLLLSEWRTENRATAFVEAAIARDRQRDAEAESTHARLGANAGLGAFPSSYGVRYGLSGSDNGDNSPG